MPRRLPPLNALRAFEAAARLGGFAAAAAELGVSPAAVSGQVKALEARFGIQLFRRLPQGLVLTAAGQACLPALSEGFDRLAEAAERARGGLPAGLVSISTLPGFAAGWLVPRLGQFRALHPEIDILLRTERRAIDFAREEADLAIRFGHGNHRGLVVRHLMDEEVFPVASPALALGPMPLRRPEDLGGHVLLHDVDAHPRQPWIHWPAWFAAFGLPPGEAARGIHFTDSIVMIAAAVAGQGVALGRAPQIGGHLKAGRLVQLFDRVERAGWAYHVIAPASRLARPAVRTFADWLLAVKD